MEEFGKLERKIAEIAKTDRGGNQAEIKEAEEKTQLAQRDAELSAAQRSASEAELKKAQELAKQNADRCLGAADHVGELSSKKPRTSSAGAAER